MTVSGNTLKHVYVLDESTTVFPYTFRILQDSDMKVILYNTTTSGETILTLTTDYTVVGAGSDSGTRTVTYADAVDYDSTYQLILQPNLAYTQPTDYEENDDFAEATHELAIDRLAIQIRQLKELLNRTFKLDASQEDEVEFPAAQAGYLYSDGSSFSWDDITVTTTDYNGTISQGTDASKPSTPVIGDIYFATDTNKLYGCWSTATWNIDWVLGDITANSITVGDIDSNGDLTVSAAVNLGGSVNILGGLLTLDATNPSIFDADPTISDDKHVATKKYVDDISYAITFGSDVTIDTYIVGGDGSALAENVTYTANTDIEVRWNGTTSSTTASCNLKVGTGTLARTDIRASCTDPSSGADCGVCWLVKSGEKFIVSTDASWTNKVLTCRTFTIS